jgi:hypothetical protein
MRELQHWRAEISEKLDAFMRQAHEDAPNWPLFEAVTTGGKVRYEK